MRMQVAVSDAVGEYIRQRSKDTGQSMSALCAFYITEYIDQKKGLQSIIELMEAAKKQNLLQEESTKVQE